MKRVVFSTLFILLLTFLVLVSDLQTALLYLYLGTSLICFALFANDKYRAIKVKSRIRERTLLVLIFLGGWPGALFAQTLCQHKTTKQPFNRILSSLILFNLFLLFLFLFLR